MIPKVAAVEKSDKFSLGTFVAHVWQRVVTIVKLTGYLYVMYHLCVYLYVCLRQCCIVCVCVCVFTIYHY